MGKPADAHHGMQTIVFTCAKGDTFQAHGHAAHGAHDHEARRLRAALSRGCTAMKLLPGARKPQPCGAKVTESRIDHAEPPPPEPAEAG